MPLNSKEVMRGSIVLYGGRVRIVKAVSELIMLEGDKNWIGASLMSGEPLTEVWLQKLGFIWNSVEGNWTTGKMSVFVKDGKIGYYGSDRSYEHIHDLQILYLAITGANLVIPKLPK